MIDKNKVQILGSPLGMYSLLREEKKEPGVEYIISILRDDGSLDIEKLNNMLARIANMGANALRDFYWIDSEDAYNKISPFWRKPDGSYEFNDRYFEHQRKIAEMCNRYNMRYYLSIFDHCGTKKKKGEVTGVWQWNPWRFFSDFFYGNDAADMRHQFIDRIVDAFDRLDTGIEICNEPRGGTGAFLADTFVYLVKKGFKQENIIIGVDYLLKEKGGDVGKDYKTLRDTAVKELDSEWDQWLKSRCISPVHKATIKGIDDLWAGEAGPGGTRRILYSQDGVQDPRPTRNDMYTVAKKVLDKKEKARKEGKVHFEVVYGKTNQDPRDSIAGVSRACIEIFGEGYLENFGQFPNPLPILDGDIEPIDESIKPIDESTKPQPHSLNTFYVNHGYRGLLGRDADASGRDDYVNFLNSGGTVLEFCQKLTNSGEYTRKRANLSSEGLARQLYQGILGRDPDQAGLPHTIEMINKGKTAERAAAMMESEEFKRKFGS